MPNTSYIIYYGIITFIVTIILCRLLQREFSVRKNISTATVPKSLSYLSLSPAIFGIILIITGILSTIGGYTNLRLCAISNQMGQFAFFFGQSSIYFFQLSRLEFCFASTNANQQYAYPNYIFLTLRIILVILLISAIVSISTLQNWIWSDFPGHALNKINSLNQSLHSQYIFTLILYTHYLKYTNALSTE